MTTDQCSVRQPGGRYLPIFERQWADVRIQISRWRSGPATEGLSQLDDHTVFVTLAGATHRTVVTLDDGQRYVGADFPGAVTFLPAGVRRHTRHETGLVEFIAFRLRQDLIPSDSTQLRAFTNQPDPVIHDLAWKCRDETRVNGGPSTLFVDNLATTLSSHLVTKYSASSPRPKSVVVDRRRLLYVLDYIKDHLAEDLRLAKLATLADMDVYQFARGFKRATGQSPHRYVIGQRVERAALLLARSTRPISEIAHEVGFASQAHLTTTFRKVVGETPLAYREDR
ncbi:helix-turn-helix domain-containing protein [Kibdelosporangium persicum]|uniref:AraC family transcriptional regulator n=1 Tax=Kibdelosporangium persicum TaxID=2698649 RepID=A0ABX2F0E2_9PSEU|nr:AraC family transcriptional regulator [Kibdelosporangium persicum]NRN64365.1 AraC family transcriptional regulator [Kibdelosporangium persicum]